eukprot:7761760-Alexandrium_andersonii.AAC.1
MSASLVGSEMCIRDRFILSCTCRGTGLPYLACWAALPRKIAARSAGAVSYTHLTLPTICSV